MAEATVIKNRYTHRCSTPHNLNPPSPLPGKHLVCLAVCMDRVPPTVKLWQLLHSQSVNKAYAILRTPGNTTLSLYE